MLKHFYMKQAILPIQTHTHITKNNHQKHMISPLIIIKAQTSHTWRMRRKVATTMRIDISGLQSNSRSIVVAIQHQPAKIR